MSWTGDQIYTKPSPELIEYLQKVDGFKHKLFHITDLEGIRFQWVIDNIFSNKENEHTEKKHDLPKNGLLAIKPNYYRSFYDKNNHDDKFWAKFEIDDDYDDDNNWNFVDESFNQEINLDLDYELNPSQIRLLNYLYFLNEKFNIPFFYYFCFMWGGDIEIEYSFVIDNGIKIYKYDIDQKKNFQVLNKELIELDTTPLQVGFQHLGFELPTWYFAPHGGCFDWKRYYIRTD